VAIGAPGEKFSYSDTGYILLGLLAEKLYGQPFYQILNEQIFNPLKMLDTTFMFYDPRFKKEELGPVVVQKQDIRLFTSLSLDYSGGGLSTTAEDLTLFAKAMAANKLICADSYAKMSDIKHHFKVGMYYGLGLMEMRFEKFFFLLKGFPRLYGHLGVLGVHTWWNPKTGDTYVLNVGNMDQMVTSFKLLIQIVGLLEQSKKKK
jgi:D-alanyl-D-alanine carboxypeptidase